MCGLPFQGGGVPGIVARWFALEIAPEQVIQKYHLDPQANKFNRIIDLLGLLYSNDLSQHDITSLYQFNVRQTNYYTDAAIYLGLVEKHSDSTIGVHYSLTALGKSILEKDSKRKNLAIVGQILCHQVFRQTLELYFAKSERPSKEEIVEIMRNANLNLGDSTTIPSSLSERANI